MHAYVSVLLPEAVYMIRFKNKLNPFFAEMRFNLTLTSELLEMLKLMTPVGPIFLFSIVGQDHTATIKGVAYHQSLYAVH